MSDFGVVLVTGVGRSGTSLAMQALARLGATVSEDVVAASEANRRGPLEDMQVRNQMLALWKRLGNFRALRPEGWRESPAAGEAGTWLTGYFTRFAHAAGGVYAVKFPLSALFLPLWRDAAETAGLQLRVVWATRGAEDTISSFLNAYGHKQEVAEAHYLQRAFYVMTDMPSDTLLLPYEGWASAPAEQLAALAAAAGLPKPDGTVLEGLYAPEIAHTRPPAGLAPLSEAACALDRAVSGHCGPAHEVIGVPEKPSRVALTRHLHDALAESSVAEAGGGVARHAAMNLSIDALTKEISRLSAENTAKDAKASDLRRENESAQTELAELRSANAERISERDAADALREEVDRLSSAQAAREAEFTELRSAYAKLVREHDAVEMAQADLRADHANELAVERNRAARHAKNELDAERKKLQKAEGQVGRIRASFRWKAVTAVTNAVRRPGRRTLMLPVDLARLWLERRRRR